MKGKKAQHHLRLGSGANESNKLASFIEQICDDYHIYDAYFGNILATNTLLAELFFEKTKTRNAHIDVFFHTSPSGMYFTMRLYESFLNIAGYFEKVKDMDADDPEAFTGEWRQAMMIRLMCDQITMEPGEESIVLVFHITGINDALTNQRIELLHKYFASINQKVTF
ncbi:MAG: hypothetical protein RG741_07965 [Bacteroidales bacterium]|nr:hypothetical protein [Bacteroidales bacterium]